MRYIAVFFLVLSACIGGSMDPFSVESYEATVADARFDFVTDTQYKADGRCAPLPPPNGRIVNISPADNLPVALNSLKTGDTALLAAGTYKLPSRRYIRLLTDGITIRGATGNARDVILDGNWKAPFGLSVGASNILLADFTIQRIYYHPVHITPTPYETITNVNLYRLRIIDGSEQAVKINPDRQGLHFVDDGVIACSHLELTDAGREQVRNNCYTGGVDAHQARGWSVRDNFFEGFWCESGLAQHAVNFWRGGRDTVIENNRIVNVTRGIGLGLTDDTKGRRYADKPCGGNIAQSYDETASNNTIFVDDPRVFTSEFGFDGGVSLASACNATVTHNTVFSTQAPFAALEYRFPLTSGVMANNLTSHTIMDRGAGDLRTYSNIEYAPPKWFVDISAGDLHLTTEAGAIDAADTDYTVKQDIDGLPRDAKPDVGSDELQQ